MDYHIRKPSKSKNKELILDLTLDDEVQRAVSQANELISQSKKF